MEIYQSIVANKLKTSFWIVLVMGLFGFFIYFLSSILFEDNYFAAGIAFIITTISALFSYFNCDKMVLNMHNAVPVNENDNQRLYNTLEDLTIAANLPMPKFYIIEESAPNAFATGRNPKNAVVCVTRGLLNKLNDEELEGVLAHELSHIKNYDILLGTMVAIFVGFIVSVSEGMLRGRGLRFLSNRRSSDSKNSGSGSAIVLLIMLILFILSPLFATLLKLAISREREYMADARAVEFTRNPNGLINALIKISDDPSILSTASKSTAHLYISNPFGKTKDSLLSTHPSTKNRIERLRNIH